MRRLLAVLIMLVVPALAATSAQAELMIIDQEDSANTSTGTWTYQAVTYPETELWLNDDSRWAYGDGSIFTWNFSGLTNDVYYVYASWANNGDGSAEAVYSGLDSGDVTINQKVPPIDATYNDIPFGYLGEVTVTDGTAAINLTSSSNYPYADAIALDSDNPPAPPREFIVKDQGDPGNTTTGTWTYQPTTNPLKELWVNDDSMWAYGDGSVFTWNFSDLENGLYEVFASWANSGDGSSAAVYSGLDSGDVTIDQTSPPVSVGIGEIPFGYLGEVTVTDGTAAISLSSSVSYPYADAIALSIIPEPSTTMLLIIGLLCGMLSFRRNRA